LGEKIALWEDIIKVKPWKVIKYDTFKKRVSWGKVGT